MIGVYTMSSVYHGLRAGTAKKVMQVIDHCAIYFLIAGTYTPILITGFLPVYPKIGWGLLAMQWVLTAVAVTLTAIDLKKYKVFSMICYIGMGAKVRYIHSVFHIFVVLASIMHFICILLYELH